MTFRKRKRTIHQFTTFSFLSHPSCYKNRYVSSKSLHWNTYVPVTAERVWWSLLIICVLNLINFIYDDLISIHQRAWCKRNVSISYYILTNSTITTTFLRQIMYNVAFLLSITLDNVEESKKHREVFLDS